MIKYYMILQKIYTTNTVYKQQILEFLPTKESLNLIIYINNKENEKLFLHKILQTSGYIFT